VEDVEIVEQEITDPTIEVGSGCEWQGRGAEPQWNNSKSAKAYDHIERHHGPKLKPEQFRGRVARTNNNQKQWLNAQDWVYAEQVIPKHPGIPGKVLIEINKKVGFRLVTKAGEKGVVNLMKLVPLVGGVVGAGFDSAFVNQCGKTAKQLFKPIN
jgi:hypothetical protein